MFNKQDPISDHRRIYGPAALIASSLSGNLQEKLDFLHPKPTTARRQMKPVRVTRARKAKS